MTKMISSSMTFYLVQVGIFSSHDEISYQDGVKDLSSQDDYLTEMRLDIIMMRKSHLDKINSVKSPIKDAP